MASSPPDDAPVAAALPHCCGVAEGGDCANAVDSAMDSFCIRCEANCCEGCVWIFERDIFPDDPDQTNVNVLCNRHRINLTPDDEVVFARIDDSVSDASADPEPWGDRFGPMFTPEQVIKAANLVDENTGKRTNLKNRESTWREMCSIFPPGTVPPAKDWKQIPNHVIAGASNWSDAFSNIFAFTQESEEFRRRESERYSRQSKKVKDCLARMLDGLMQRRPTRKEDLLPPGQRPPFDLQVQPPSLPPLLPPRPPSQRVQQQINEQMEEVQARHSEERQEALRQLVGYQRQGGRGG